MESGAMAILGIFRAISDTVRSISSNRELAESLQSRLISLEPIAYLDGTQIFNIEAYLKLKRILNELQALVNKIANKSRFRAFFTSGNDKKKLQQFEKLLGECVIELNLVMNIQSYKLLIQQQNCLSLLVESTILNMSKEEDRKCNATHALFLTNANARNFYETYYDNKASLCWGEFWNCFKLELEAKFRIMPSVSQASQLRELFDQDKDGYVDVKELNTFYETDWPQIRGHLIAQARIVIKRSVSKDQGPKVIKLPSKKKARPRPKSAAAHLDARRMRIDSESLVHDIKGLMNDARSAIRSLEHPELSRQIDNKLKPIFLYGIEITKLSKPDHTNLSSLYGSFTTLPCRIETLRKSGDKDSNFQSYESQNALKDFDAHLNLMIQQQSKLLRRKLKKTNSNTWRFDGRSPFNSYVFDNEKAKKFYEKYYDGCAVMNWIVFWMFYNDEVSLGNAKLVKKTDLKKLFGEKVGYPVAVAELDQIFNKLDRLKRKP